MGSTRRRSEPELWAEFRTTRDPKTRNEIFEIHYALLVRIVVNRRYGLELPYSVALSHGSLGLIDAIESFDPSKATFSTWATQKIVFAIVNGVREENPEVAFRLRGKLKAVAETLDAQGNPETFDLQKLSESSGLSDSETRKFLQKLKARRDLSEKSPVCISEIEIPKGDGDFSENILLDNLREAVENLNEREKKIMIKHYYENKTLTTVAAELGISKQRASQLHFSICKRFREDQNLWTN